MRFVFLSFFALVAAIAQTTTLSPGLDGQWVSNSATPLERPEALAGRSTLTDAEVAEFRRRAARLSSDDRNDFAAGDNLFLAVLQNNVERYHSQTATSNAGDMIERIFDNRTSLIVDPPNGRIPPLTEAAKLSRAAMTHAPPQQAADLLPHERCLSYGVPRLGGNFGSGNFSYYQIFETPGYMLFYMEAVHEARIIAMDGRPHLPPNVRSWDGDSIGHWEGRTLVVDTTNLPRSGGFMGAGPRLHLIEKFTRISADELRYEVTIDDPDTWTAPWTAQLPLRRSADRLFEYACHEGNETVMKGMLEVGPGR
jgi:hypothetical protein